MPSAAGRRDDLTILNGRRVRFGHIQRKNILNFAFGATAFAERSVAIKAPVGLLSGRAVCVSRWRGFAPTSSAERSKRFFHRRGCNGKMHLIFATLLVKMAERNARRRSVLPKSEIIFP